MTKNIRVLLGEDTFRLRSRLRLMQRAFVAKFPDGDLSVLEGHTLGPVQNALLTGSLFGGRRLIVVQDFTAIWDELVLLLKQAEHDETISVILALEKPDKRTKVYKALSKGAFVVEDFSPLKSKALADWCVRQANGQLQLHDAEHLIARCGTNGWHLHNEINKLCTHAGGETISQAAIDALTLPHPEAEIWGMLRSFSGRRSARAMSEYAVLRETGVSPHMVLAMLMREARLLVQLKQADAEGLSAKDVGISPFVTKSTTPNARKWQWRELHALYALLVHTDLGIKTGGIQMSTHDETELDIAVEQILLCA